MSARHLIAILLSCGVVGCGGPEKTADRTSASDDATAKKTTTKKKTPAASDDAGTEDGTTEAGADDGSGDTDGAADGGADDGTIDGGQTDGDAAEGEAFFNLTVAPMMQVQCIGCHADPRMPVEVRAPLSIYSYKSMKALLADGKASQNNAAFDKMRNIAAHTGGDRCSKGPSVTPCKEIVEWWHKEFGEDTGGTQKIGRITDISSVGKVYGYAFDPADTATAVTVNFYADGDKDAGTAAGSTVANFDGSDSNTPGAHAFNFTLPDALKNGKAHTLMAYAVIRGVEMPLSDVATAYTSYSFTTAGRNYYEANVKGAMGQCTGCHNVNYETQFYSMLSPSPAQGATKTNNQLINKPALTNSTTHGGGKLCATANSSPCSQFQTWWTLEFGN